MAVTIRKLTLPVLVALGLCVFSVTASLLHVSWDPTSSVTAANAAPAKKTGVAALRKARVLLTRGKAIQASKLLNGAISSGSLAGSDMASALYYRGLALRKMGKPAQAVADFTNALWLKNGLSAAQRADAERARTDAYREAGMIAKKPVSKVAIRRPAAQMPVPTQRVQRLPQARQPQARVQPKPTKEQKSTSSGIGGFFSNLFGGKKKEVASQPVPARVQAQGVRDSDGRITQVSAWSSRTQVNSQSRPNRSGARPVQIRGPVQNGRASQNPRASQNVRRAARPAQVAARQPARQRVVATRRSPAGRSSVGAVRVVPRRRISYGLILSPVRSLKVANANAVTVTQRFGQVLGQVKPVVEQMAFGGSTFYQVRIGPFADAAPPGAVCARLKAAGIDCILSKY